MSTLRESQPVALVTGVSKPTGLGLEIARQLGQRGYCVAVTARSATTARAMADLLTADRLVACAYALDVTSRPSLAACEAALRSDLGRLDVLVNNAAISGPFGETVGAADPATGHAVMEAILFGSWAVTQTFLPLLRAAPAGRIVNVSSGAGSHGDPLFGLASGNAMGPSYAVAKAALNALSHALARELADTPIKVNSVCPGFTATFPGGEAMGARPVAEGAAGTVWAATLPADGPTGGFFRDGVALPW